MVTTRRNFFNLGLAVLAAPFIIKPAINKEEKSCTSLKIGPTTIEGLEPGSTYHIYATRTPQFNGDVFLGKIASELKRAKPLKSSI